MISTSPPHLHERPLQGIERDYQQRPQTEVQQNRRNDTTVGKKPVRRSFSNRIAFALAAVFGFFGVMFGFVIAPIFGGLMLLVFPVAVAAHEIWHLIVAVANRD